MRRRVALLAGLVAAGCLFTPLPSSAGPIVPPPNPCLFVSAPTCGTLTIGYVGTGSGTITSSPAGINCTVVKGVKSSTGCSALFTSQTAQITVFLTATPAPGSLAECEFDPAAATPCVNVELWNGGPWDHPRSVFKPTTHALTVTKSGEGSGRVKSSAPGIDCGAKCSASFDFETTLTLTATPDAGAVFKQWTGACVGQGASCSLTITEAISTNAVFDLAGASGGQPAAPGAPAGPGAGAEPGGAASPAVVAADVIAASAGKSRLGRRVVRLELRLDEDVSATLTLLRRGTVLITKQFRRVREGERVLTLLVPRGTKRGKATLTFELKDGRGNVLSGKRSVSITRA
jgi:hypothetical protein